MSETAEPTHCIRGHPAMWCTCRTFKPAPNGKFTDFPMIAYPPPPQSRTPCDCPTNGHGHAAWCSRR